ncbi:MAG: efflux RND transporter periplasmic adaptor subunit [Clostridia bacterium]|nr:efflux RND transporter periplasmic adaptor subunit [Clostridia bacterium]
MSEASNAEQKKKRPRRKRHMLRKLLILLIVLVVMAGGALYAYESLRQKYTITYTGYTATTGSISNALSFSGSMTLIDNTTHAAGGDGSVRVVYVQAGDTVKKGDKLLRLSTGETITADFDGRVNSLKVAQGDAVAAGDALVQVADFTNMKVSIRVDEYDIADVHVGQRCTVTATATEQTFESTVREIDYISSSSGNVAYYTATAYVQVGEGVYPGMQVTVSIPQEEAKDVVVLKMDALSFDETNSAYVYMADETGAMAKRPVEVGVSNGNYVEIRSGLSAGDRVFAETKQQTASGLDSLLSSFFNQPGNTRNQRNQRNTNPGGSQSPTRNMNSMPGGGGWR